MKNGHRSRHTPCAVPCSHLAARDDSFRGARRPVWSRLSETRKRVAQRLAPAPRWLGAGCIVVGLAVACCAAPPADTAPQVQTTNKNPAPSERSKPAAASAEKQTEQSTAKPTPKYITQSLRGKVVWLNEAVSRKYGVRLDADMAQSVAALETTDGELIPIMKEDRGRGFWKDARLRGVDLELMVRRYKGLPMVQVIRVYRLRDGKKYELDYWCDVCSIQMFELKQCECCQGPTRLRERLVEEKK
jgi:hypothetical protein